MLAYSIHIEFAVVLNRRYSVLVGLFRIFLALFRFWRSVVGGVGCCVVPGVAGVTGLAGVGGRAGGAQRWRAGGVRAVWRRCRVVWVRRRRGWCRRWSWLPRARRCRCWLRSGAGALGFAGTAGKESVGQPAGLTVLADEFGDGAPVPMLPGSWGPDLVGVAGDGGWCQFDDLTASNCGFELKEL